MRVPLLDQLAMAQEQFGVMRGAMASLRLSRTDLALLTLRKIWHDEVVLTIRSLLETYENIAEQFGVLRGAMSSLRLTRWQLFMLTLRQLFHNMPSFVKYSLFAVVTFGVVVVLDNIYARFTSLRNLGLPVLEFPRGDDRWDYKRILRLGKERASLFSAYFAHCLEALT